ncbi:hypothetical protein [Sediminibacterium sp.]|uniref:hypothetical protein n=1 Tax=Sediminibacterium sp. TaxID=1917865 RepID=UPI0025E080F8|nr:hypothetical protein [Sediminibacterium sp.]MBT9483745.1 hypothetical protein [Sediminibacterium sp.]
MNSFFGTLGLLFFTMLTPYCSVGQSHSTITSTPYLTPQLEATVNGKPMQFNQGKLQAYIAKEDGEITILAQTSTDILNTNILTWSIIPVDTNFKVSKGEFKILPEEKSSNFNVRAEYSSIKEGNSSYWWTNTKHQGGGILHVDEITNNSIKGRFSFIAILEKEDGEMNPKEVVKVTNGKFSLPLETKSRLELP